MTTKVFPMLVRRADKRPAPEVQADDHVNRWLVYRSRPPAPLTAWAPPPNKPRAPAKQHAAHVSAYQAALLAPLLLERRIKAQLEEFSPENFKRAFIRLHKRRSSVNDSDIFHYLTKEIWPGLRWAPGNDGSLNHRMTEQFAIRIQAWWNSRPSGLGLIESKVGGAWIMGAAPIGKYPRGGGDD